MRRWLGFTRLPWVSLILLGLAWPRSGHATMQRLVDAFAQSDFEFSREESHVPLPAMSWLRYGYYGEQSFDDLSEDPEERQRFALHELSQAFALPIPITERSLVVVGEYLQWARFRFEEPDSREEDVFSIGIPLGWAMQVKERWQAALFVMPFAHSSLGGSGPWEAEWMGGAFGRYRFDDGDLLFGAVVDEGFGEVFVYPYLGGNWRPNESWTLSLVLPWPSVLYAPDDGWLLRVGASPSGGRWNLEGEDELDVAFGGWALVASLAWRATGFLWLSAEGGITGLNSLRISESGDARFETDVDTQPFVRVGLELRP